MKGLPNQINGYINQRLFCMGYWQSDWHQRNYSAKRCYISLLGYLDVFEFFWEGALAQEHFYLQSCSQSAYTSAKVHVCALIFLCFLCICFSWPGTYASLWHSLCLVAQRMGCPINLINLRDWMNVEAWMTGEGTETLTGKKQGEGEMGERNDRQLYGTVKRLQRKGEKQRKRKI